TITHSALLSRSRGMSSGMSSISFRTVPQFFRRCSSFSSSATTSGEMDKINVATDARHRFMATSFNHKKTAFKSTLNAVLGTVASISRPAALMCRVTLGQNQTALELSIFLHLRFTLIEDNAGLLELRWHPCQAPR